MIRALSEEELRQRALEALIQSLGPAEAMRFLSMVRQGSRDYQKWRDEHFKGLTPEQVVDGLKRGSHRGGSSGQHPAS